MNWLEVVGFAASALVAISLMMSNVFWLRVINLVGGAVFTVYGILIHSAPVAVMNAVTDALGVRDVAMPATPLTVWKAMQPMKKAAE
mgnify:CR=1 FL=1